MWVADIQDKCILGLDYLECDDCIVNLKDSSLRVRQQEFPLRKSSLETTCVFLPFPKPLCQSGSKVVMMVLNGECWSHLNLMRKAAKLMGDECLLQTEGDSQGSHTSLL